MAEQEIPQEQDTGKAKLFQITESDLADLERLLPRMCDLLTPSLDNPTRMMIRQVQQIVLRVRWDYGPPNNVGIIAD